MIAEHHRGPLGALRPYVRRPACHGQRRSRSSAKQTKRKAANLLSKMNSESLRDLVDMHVMQEVHVF